jgi:hypothetical protein
MGAETDSWAKFGTETVVGHTGGQNGFHIMVRRLTQALLRLYSGSTQALLMYAQALIRYAHPQLRYAHPQLRLKQQLLTSGD